MIGWLDLSAGASGDMLLGALVDAGVPLEILTDAVAALPVERVLLTAEPDSRHGLGGTRVHVHAPESGAHRTWADVRRPPRRPGRTGRGARDARLARSRRRRGRPGRRLVGGRLRRPRRPSRRPPLTPNTPLSS